MPVNSNDEIKIFLKSQFGPRAVNVMIMENY
jgi:hypothetical protein